MIVYGIISFLVILFDQITKLLVSANYSYETKNILIPHIINLVYRKNTGAAFSILSEHVSLLGIISVLFCIGLIIYVIKCKPEHPLLKTSLTMIFSGAFGNGIDRVFRGFVVDFIETDFIDFPVFNIADISITVGAALLIIYIIFYDKSNN